MKMEHTKMRGAGVLRCCFSLGYKTPLKEVSPGDKASCEHCNQEFILTKHARDLTWIPAWQLTKDQN